MEHSDNFLKWLKDSDAFISPKIAIKDYAEQGARLGVVALDDIKVKFTPHTFIKWNLIHLILMCRKMKFYSLFLVSASYHEHLQSIAIKSERIVKKLAGFL